jgi:hypothetical protein
MWHRNVDAVSDVDDGDAVVAEVEEDPPPPPPISQAEPPSLAEGGHATTPPSPLFSCDWFDVQFQKHQGAGRY